MEQLNSRTAVGHQVIMPYLIIENAAAFIQFAQDVFNMKLQTLVPRSEGVIMHAELQCEGSTIMLADATEDFKPQPSGMFIYVNNADAIYQKALKQGATSIMEPSDQNYGRAAGVKDAWGNTWWITSL
ncbi:MAG: VOC family protein [Bacteroidota bacterium]